MFADFLKSFLAPEPAPLSDGDCRLALTALLIRVAKTDGHFDADEAAQIDAILAKRYGLGAEEIDALRQRAQELEREAPDTVRFTKALKDTVPIEERKGIIEALWSVVLADGVRDDEENALLRMVSNFLGVSDKDSALARQRAQAQRG